MEKPKTLTQLTRENAALREKLSRKGTGRKPFAPRCACGAMIDTPRQRKRNPAHECWSKTILQDNEITLDAN